MRSAVRAAVAVAGVCAGVLLWTVADAATERPPAAHALAPAPRDGTRVIVKFKEAPSAFRALAARAGSKRASELATRLGLPLSDGRALGPRTQVITGAGLSSEQLAALLRAQPDVEYAVVDARRYAVGAAANDPLLPSNSIQSPAAGQWYLQVPGTTLSASLVGNSDPLVSAINVEAAWAITTGNASVVVADLDTGIRPEHPDLAGKVLPGYDLISDLGRGNNGSLQNPDATDPGDWVTTVELTDPSSEFYHCMPPDANGNYVGQNSSWHGTQTAGIIAAATNNLVGMAGVGRDVMLLPVRVLGKCGGLDSDIIAGMQWAAGVPVPGVPTNPHVARVINMSLGGSPSDCNATAYQDVINTITAPPYSVTVVIAAGNDGMAVSTPGNCSGVIAVGGVRHTGTKVGYSNLGPEVAISAPAGNCVNLTGTCIYPILTTSNSGATGPSTSIYTNGDTVLSLGTSFSTPQVAGTVALMLSANPSLTPSQIHSVLQSTARAFPATGASGVPQCVAPTSVAQNECVCTTSTCGAGLLDAGAAVAAVAIVSANISVPSTGLIPGTAVTLDGSASIPNNATFAWTVSPSNGIASFSGSVSAPTATLLASAPGTVTVTVSLTVTDAQGHSSSASKDLTFALATVTPPASSGGGSSGGGGGGAMELGWLLGWLASVIGVWFVTPRRKPRDPGTASRPPRGPGREDPAD